MRHRLIVLTLAAALLATPLLAATTQPNASQRQKELINELIDAMHMDQIVMQSTDAMLEQMMKQFVSEDNEDGKWFADHFRELVRQQVDFKTLTRDLFLQVYPKYFTEDDLTQLVAFYRSPTGQKMLTTMPAVMRDSMQLSQSTLGAKMQEIVKQVMADAEKRKPWVRTMKDMRTIATAVEAYATDHDGTYPRAADFASLGTEIEEYVDDMPEKDVWGNAYAYVVSPDAKHYRIVSSGSDGNFEWDSRRIAEGKASAVRYSDRLEDDLVYADGEFLQLPKAAKPKKD